MAQHFFIRQNSTLPIVKMKLYKDGRTDYKKLFEDLESAAITFSMINTETGRLIVANKAAFLLPVEKDCCEEDVEYYIAYKFTEKETRNVGCFRGEFKINFLDDGCSLIVPVRDDLIINVRDSFVKSDIIC